MTRDALDPADAPLVSVVLLTRNGASTLPPVLDALARQQVTFGYEVVAVDSGSTDDTAALLRGRVDRLITIGAEEFDHGLTRNLAIEQTRGEFVVLLVQDAVPAHENWLSELTGALRRDSRAAGAFARQQPRSEASAIARVYHARWVAAAATPRTVAVSSLAHFESLTPRERLDLCAFDNVCSCVRRSVWETHPFRRTPMAEDLEWAKEVLLAGHHLVYASSAVVTHSHDRPARYEFARTYILHRRLYELFRLQTIPTVGTLVRAIGSSLVTHLRCRREPAAGGRHPVKLGRAIALAVAWPLGQYLGARSAARGWKAVATREV